MRKISKSDQAFWTKYGISPDAPNAPRGMLLEDLYEEMMRTISAMSPDEKAHLRYEMRKSSGIPPKTADGKPH
jgi:hypothetical protein